SKNYEAYTAYMLNNFCEVAAEIWKLQPKNLYAVGLIDKSRLNEVQTANVIPSPINPFPVVILANAGIQIHR
ncbi:MAG: hypothetical protein AAB968_05170, partial [Patescibacteria group bacterium]